MLALYFALFHDKDKWEYSQKTSEGFAIQRFLCYTRPMNTDLKPKLHRFAGVTAFACPICHAPLSLDGTSFKCPQHHSFDLAKFGYVHLAPQIKQSQDYDKENFQNRQLILEAGFYQHILDKLTDLLQSSSAQTILDVGCGEGYYSRNLHGRFPDKSFYAFDISKDSVQLAAKSEPAWQVKWFVGDLTQLPIQTASMDMVLDIFSPANYGEFARVLKKDGVIIKVVPTENHLKEIRHIVQDQVQKKSYSNQDILQHFEQHSQVLTTETVSLTKTLTDEEKQALLAMTPLLFHVDSSQIDWEQLTEITIEASILVGCI